MPLSPTLQGKGNLSPYSYFGVMSHDPPYVTIGTCATSARPSGMKDSQQNILETGWVHCQRTASSTDNPAG